ncbi:hypothetical protein ABT072_25805 [Streptomyces sp. NPDC002589]|uniref:hypothetical protein n=1 Tax=Streptomyces sp. NPDC002589 TaxID=3154420 RepID=UPI00331CDD96
MAKLLNSLGGVQDKPAEAFTQASRLGVTSKLTSLKSLRFRATNSAPDLRKRATYARLEIGDSNLDVRWAGLTQQDLGGATPTLCASDHYENRQQGVSA